MKISTRVLSTGAFSAIVAFGMTGAATLAQAQAPQVSIQSEEAAHPRLVKAIHEMRHAIEELKAAPDDFGGHKGQAIQDTEHAIHSVKKALYFRLKLDDAALDRIDG